MGDTRQGGPLEPDRDQLEIFVNALFRYATPQAYVSVRAFFEDGAKPFRISPTSLVGGLNFLIDVAEDDARRAANAPERVVFCPPIATFATKERARERDLVEGLALSVECDHHPQRARETLEQLIGPATLVVRSGGIWTDANGAAHDKLHLHWRLAKPARGDDLPKLKALRDLATRIVGGDPSNKPICHPIRWPGSWHRKSEPRLCEIASMDIDHELDIATALEILGALTKNLRPTPNGKPNGAGERQRVEWEEAFAAILTGRSYHPTLVPLAASMAAWGAPEPVTDNVLRSLLINSGPGDPERERRRVAELAKLPQTVASAYEKFGGEEGKSRQQAAPSALNAKELNQMTFDPIKYVVPGYIVEGLTLLAGKPKIGKSWLLLQAAIAVARGGFTLGDVHCVEGDVLYAALEDGPRRLQSRMRKLIGTQEAPARLYFTCEMPRLTRGGLDFISSGLRAPRRHD
jgi:AAA domain